MSEPSATMPTLTVAIVSSQCLVWLGLQNILSSMTVPMVVHSCFGRISDLLHTECRPYVFIEDLETEPDALAILTQIREPDLTVRSFCYADLSVQTACPKRLPPGLTVSSSKCSRPPGHGGLTIESRRRSRPAFGERALEA